MPPGCRSRGTTPLTDELETVLALTERVDTSRVTSFARLARDKSSAIAVVLIMLAAMQITAAYFGIEFWHAIRKLINSKRLAPGRKPENLTKFRVLAMC